jgi:hypothetical protein
MMQNVSATDPRGISLEAEICFAQYRLATTSDIGSRSSGSCPRAPVLQGVLPGLAPAPTPTASPAPSGADGGVRRPFTGPHAAEEEGSFSVLKDLTSLHIPMTRGDTACHATD